MIEGKEAQTPRKLMDAIAHRWSPRAFSDKKVEHDKLLRTFEAARWAASSRNEQPWRFVVAYKGDPHYEALYNALDEGNKSWAHTAPVIGAAVAKLHFDYKNRPNHHAVYDLGQAMGGLLAQATHEGLHIHQMAGFDPQVIEKHYALNGEEYRVVAMFVIGYQDDGRLPQIPEKNHKSEYASRMRRPLGQLVMGAEWGDPPKWLGSEE